MEELEVDGRVASVEAGRVAKRVEVTELFVIGSAKRGTSSKKWFREKGYLKN